jgi:hypothetical protein
MVRHRECCAYVPKTAYSRPGADATPLQNGGAPCPLDNKQYRLDPTTEVKKRMQRVLSGRSPT